MPRPNFISYLKDKRFTILLMLIILFGISYRVTLFIQNRNLIIDEANVVRNVYERNLLGLLKPLSYEQYAPPLYLWQLELSSWLFGYSEYAMRLPALIWGIAALFMYTLLTRKLMSEKAVWFTVGLLAGAPPLVKYSAEVKQYGPDLCIAVILTYCALKADIFTWTKSRFFRFWAICGSLALWASQPAVFVLACVGFYYFTQCVQQKKWEYWKLLLPIALLWFIEFAIYYKLILEPQINSPYLQGYHHDYFLYATPANMEEWRHNWIRFKEIINNTVGYSHYSYYISFLLIPLGAFTLLRRSLPQFILVCGPVLLTLVAAALNQFSLIERVALFILPFTMLTTGLGFAELLKAKWLVLRTIFIAIGINMLWQFNMRQVFFKRFLFQEITIGFDYLIQHQVPGKEVYIDCASKDTYIYYLDIHPDRDKYKSLRGAYIMPWEEHDFVALGKRITTPRAFFIFTGGGEEHLNDVVKGVSTTIPVRRNYDLQYCKLVEFAKP